MQRSFEWDEISEMASKIVTEALRLCDQYNVPSSKRVSYCAIFTQSQEEYAGILQSVERVGLEANNTPTGPVFVTPSIDTTCGQLRILKVRAPDHTRPERGDADFALEDYSEFKGLFLPKAGFKIIEREEFEMVELMDSKFFARAYFSSPPVETHGRLPEALTEFGY